MKYLMPLAALSFIPLSQAATIQVTAGAVDDTINGNCSLVEAVRAANSNQAVDACVAGERYIAGHTTYDVINIPAGRYLFTQATGTAALPDISSNMILIGQGAKSWNTTIERSATATTDFGLIYHSYYPSKKIRIENLHFKNGKAANGGAISTTGPLNVTDSTFENNSAVSEESDEGRGGAIYVNASQANVYLSRNTYLNNSASNSGGAIYVGRRYTNNVHFNPAIENSTFYQNTLSNNDGKGSAIRLAQDVRHIPVRFNTFFTRQRHDLVVSYSTPYYGNLIDRGLLGLCEKGVNISSGLCLDLDTGDFEFFYQMGLEPLADNGGKTKTMALNMFSPAIQSRSVSNYSLNRYCTQQQQRTDQIGQSRGTKCDHGAIQYDATGEVEASRRFIYGMQEPRIAFYHQDGAILELDDLHGQQINVVWQDYQPYSENPSYYRCTGNYGGSLSGWMDTVHDYAFLNKKESQSPMPSYACPIWLKPRP